MGMYTEVLIKARLTDAAKRNDLVLGVVRYLFSEAGEPENLPEHEFFDLPRWKQIGKMSSFYHHPQAMSSFYEEYGSSYIFSRSDIKNYYGEIEAFFDWIRPHCDSDEDECIGYSWYEEDASPKLIFGEKK